MEPLVGALLAGAAEALVGRLLDPLTESVIRSSKGQLPPHPNHRARELLAGYITRTYTNLCYLSALALQNQRRELLQLYLPLIVREDASKKQILLDRYDQNRVLLTDTAGMGKSTILKFLFLSCIHHDAGIPVFIELRRLSAQAVYP